MDIINFGFAFDDQNWSFAYYIPNDILTAFITKKSQIDKYQLRVNWIQLSRRKLAIDILVTYKNNIDWVVYLTNGHPIHFLECHQVIDILNQYQHLFLTNITVKKAYYKYLFMDKFPHLIDWPWAGKHMKLPEYILLKYWEQITTVIISRYQTLEEDTIIENAHRLNWIILSAQPHKEEFIRQYYYNFRWNVLCKKHYLSSDLIDEFIYLCDNKIVCRYQRLTDEFLNKHIDWIDMDLVCRYQRLSDDFMNKYFRKLNLEFIQQYQQLSDEFLTKNFKRLNVILICKYQPLSVDFIKKNIDKLYLDILANNKHFNQSHSVQIISAKGRWYIIDKDRGNQFNFCSL